jgi:hypothetical protein
MCNCKEVNINKVHLGEDNYLHLPDFTVFSVMAGYGIENIYIKLVKDPLKWDPLLKKWTGSDEIIQLCVDIGKYQDRTEDRQERSVSVPRINNDQLKNLLDNTPSGSVNMYRYRGIIKYYGNMFAVDTDSINYLKKIMDSIAGMYELTDP